MKAVGRWHRQLGALKEDGIAEIKALRPKDRRMTGDEDDSMSPGSTIKSFSSFTADLSRMISSAVASGRLI